MGIFYAAIFFILTAIILLWQSSRSQKATGLPGGRVIYTDTHAWGDKIEKPLYNSALGLTGKPDYLVEKNGRTIPVEIKSGRAPRAPYDAHIYQLAAYCLLVEKNLGSRPPYGIIHYEDLDFAVDYTSALENALLDILADMRRDDRFTTHRAQSNSEKSHREEVDRSHKDGARCAKCGFRNVCDQKL